ncbi:MAG: hypothetical protein LUD00_02750 [Prevotellaceae bacterium]|nr:hypothetical protein [Prevotellaceae bacterium]
MKRRFLSAILLLSSMAVSASIDGINALMIHGKSGEKVTILLDEKPAVRFEGDDIVVTTHMNVVSYVSADVVKFTYVSVTPDGMSNPGLFGAVFSFGNDFVRMENQAPHIRVSIYSVDGKLLSSVMTDSKGCASMQLPEPTAAVYVVKTPSSTFKISRP